MHIEDLNIDRGSVCCRLRNHESWCFLFSQCQPAPEKRKHSFFGHPEVELPGLAPGLGQQSRCSKTLSSGPWVSYCSWIPSSALVQWSDFFSHFAAVPVHGHTLSSQHQSSQHLHQQKDQKQSEPGGRVQTWKIDVGSWTVTKQMKILLSRSGCF